MTAGVTVVYQTPASKTFKVDIDQVDPFDFDLKARGQEEQPEDSFDFAVVPADNANDVPVDLELVLLNDVSGSLADTKYDLTAANDGATEGWGVPWSKVTDFIHEQFPGREQSIFHDEMPDDFPAGLVVQQDFDLML